MGRMVPTVVSAGFEARDPQDHDEGEERFCTGDGAQDAGLGGAFGKPLTSEAESGSAEQRQENSDRSCEDALLLFNLRDGVDQLLAVLLYGLDGDDRTRTTAAPARNGRARDSHVLGQASGTAPDDLIAKTVVVRAAHP